MLNIPEKTEKTEKSDAVEHLLAEFAMLRDQNRYMQNILLNLPELFYWMDLDGRVVNCNERQASYFGMKRDDFIGMSIFDLAERMGWDIEVAKRVRENDAYVMETGQSLIKEEQCELDGKVITFLSYKHPLYDANKVLIGVFGLSIDITDRKKMELDLLEQKRYAEEANRAKTNFLMNISHDVY